MYSYEIIIQIRKFFENLKMNYILKDYRATGPIET